LVGKPKKGSKKGKRGNGKRILKELCSYLGALPQTPKPPLGSRNGHRNVDCVVWGLQFGMM